MVNSTLDSARRNIDQEKLQERKKLLICIDWFDPAFKAGGPIRSCVNLANQLSGYYDIYVLTGDRDLGSAIVLEGITFNCWLQHTSGSKVWYASSGTVNSAFIKSMITSLKPDYIYLNSMFSKTFTIDVIAAHRKLKNSAKIILAPRGMLKPSALAVKPLKKKIFFFIVNILKTYKAVHFHATNEAEAAEVKNIFRHSAVSIADNFPAAISENPLPLAKTPGQLMLVLVGRIHPIKSIDFLLQQLYFITGKVQLDIIGVQEEQDYFQRCQAIAEGLPKDISVRFTGELPHQLLDTALTNHHLFVLPTTGENFGHAIAEALGNGRPVLISDQTPWRDLKPNNAGWDYPLSSPLLFQQALQEAVYWDQVSFDKYCKGALAFARTKQDTKKLIHQYQQLFN